MEKQHTESPIHYSITTQSNQPSSGDNLQSSDFDSDKYNFRPTECMQEQHHQEHEESPKDNKDESMRWVFLVFVMVCILAAIILPSLTRNVLCPSLFAYPAPLLGILYRITRYLFPKSKEEYNLQALKIRHRIEKKRRDV